MTFEPQYLAFYTLPGPGGEIEQQIMEQEIRDRMPGPQYARYAQKYPDNIRDLRFCCSCFWIHGFAVLTDQGIVAIAGVQSISVLCTCRQT